MSNYGHNIAQYYGKKIIFPDHYSYTEKDLLSGNKSLTFQSESTKICFSSVVSEIGT